MTGFLPLAAIERGQQEAIDQILGTGTLHRYNNLLLQKRDLFYLFFKIITTTKPILEAQRVFLHKNFERFFGAFVPLFDPKTR